MLLPDSRIASLAGESGPTGPVEAPVIGVLGLQGAAHAHVRALTEIGAHAVIVKTPALLEGLSGIVLPGGESTTMSKLLESQGLLEPLRSAIRAGVPTFGTCAGMILCAAAATGGRPDQHQLDVIDIDVARNAYGRQIDSFETDISVSGLAEPFRAVFIRAPRVTRLGEGVEVLATVEGEPVLCRQGAVLVAAFHPELSGDLRIHELFCSIVSEGGS